MMDTIELFNYVIAFLSVFSVTFFILLMLTYKKEYDHEPELKPGWTPKISVIIPAYNESEHLGKCLQTLLELDYPEDQIEIIVVDDGSTDNTNEVARSYEKNGVVVYSKKNGGKGAALNYGLERAGGEFIATMDADSYVMPKTLKQLLAYFQDQEVMAVSAAVKIKPTGSPIKELQRVEYLMILFSRKLLSFIDAVPVTPGPFSMFRARVFKELGGFDEGNLVEDQEIALRMQAQHYKIKSSVTADVFTTPPDNFTDLLKQRVRWQRGGVRNYWKYRFTINPKYGDFGLFLVPMHFATLAAFFIMFGLMIYTFFFAPYYTRYVFIESLGIGFDTLFVPTIFTVISAIVWLYFVISSFKDEHVKLRYILVFFFFYWYLMLGYNLLMVYKEIRREKFHW